MVYHLIFKGINILGENIPLNKKYHKLSYLQYLLGKIDFKRVFEKYWVRGKSYGIIWLNLLFLKCKKTRLRGWTGNEY